MSNPRILENFDSEEIKIFLNSFDTVITDCDGVLLLGTDPIEGSFETLTKLQSLGKKIIFASNNTSMTMEQLCGKIRISGYPATSDQIAIPTSVICWYLKKLGFNGKAFVLGMKPLRQALEEAGIDVGEPGPYKLEERIEDVLANVRNVPDVDAVIVDIDVNVNWAKMTRAIKYLKNREILYLVGTLDRKFPIYKNSSLLGIVDFVDIISKESKRTPVECAKPSAVMRDYIIEKFSINDPGRCIFIGDSLDSDMKFADLCGFSKLWVGTGVDTLTSDQNSTNELDSSLRYYYLPRLGLLRPLLDKLSLLGDV